MRGLPKIVNDIPYTTGEAADLTGMSPSQVSRLRRRGVLGKAGDVPLLLSDIARFARKTHRQDRAQLMEHVARAINKANSAPVACDTCDESGEITWQAGGYEQPEHKAVTCPCCRGKGEHTPASLKKLGGKCLDDAEAFREYEQQTWGHVLGGTA